MTFATLAKKQIATEKKAVRAQESKQAHYLNLAKLLRQGRIHRMLIDGEHMDHTFANGEHVDFYASKTYPGFAYMVADGECGCEQFENCHGCKHTKDASQRAVARYHEAKRQSELATAEQVAPLVLGEMSQDLQVHVEDTLSAPADPWTDENYDPFAGMTATQRREAYRSMYPDDFAA